MTPAATLEKLQPMIADRCGFDASRITPDALLIADLGLDSLDMVELVLSVEEAFGIAVADEVLEKIQTVKDVVDAVDHELSSQGDAR